MIPAPEPSVTSEVELHGPHPHHPPRRVSGKNRRRLVIGLLAVLGVAGATAGAGMLKGFLPHPVVAGDPKATGLTEGRGTGVQTVKVVRPRHDPNFRITTEALAVVEPYYQAGLRSRVSGVVRYVAKDIGEPVRAGELLVEIDVPDLDQAVLQKDAVVRQREQELAAAEANLPVARAAVRAASVAVQQKEVEIARAKDLLGARKFDLDAKAILLRQGSVPPNVVESAKLDYQAAGRAVESAHADVEKAKVEQAGKAASAVKAEADIELARAFVEVARRDRDAAAVQLGYTRLYAPFDGTVASRSVDPGKFVSGGSGGASEILITVARTDLVTVAMKLPDKFASFVTWGTEAHVEFAQLPGVTVRGPVTRFSPVIDSGDRTMRVEVDVYNGARQEYDALMQRAAANATIGPLLPLDRAAGVLAAGSGLIRSRADHKGWHEGYALIPDWGVDSRYRQIVPGTNGVMRLDLENFANAYLLPAGAVFSRIGQPYILVVEDGVTKSLPVTVTVSDGRLSMVALVTPGPGGRQVTRSLTGNELIVASRQVEIGDDQKVETVVQNW